jgi:probable rRNA maturation factor
MAMASTHLILVYIDEPFSPSLSAARLEALARRVLDSEATPPSELSVAVTGDDTLRRLNRQYAGQDAVTDVLSFSQQEGEEFVAPPRGTAPLGEVIISYPQARRQAPAAVDREVERLLVHGILHLLGYDHAVPDEEREMRSREETLAVDAAD